MYSARVSKMAYIRGLPKGLTEAFYSEEGELRGTGAYRVTGPATGVDRAYGQAYDRAYDNLVQECL